MTQKYLLYIAIFINYIFVKIYIKSNIEIIDPELTEKIISYSKHILNSIAATFILFIINELLRFRILFLTIILINGIINIAILLYFKYFAFVPYIEQIINIKNIGEIGNQIFYQIFDTYNIMYIILYLTIIYLSFFSEKTSIVIKKKYTYSFLMTSLLIFLYNYYRSDYNDYLHSRNACFVKNGLIYTLSMDLKENIDYNKYINYKIINNEKTIEKNIHISKNIIILQVESLDDSTIKILPNSYLSKLKDSSIYYENFYSQHSGGGTTDAELSSLFSLLPLQSRVGLIQKDYNHLTTLPKILKTNHFDLAMFHAYSAEFFNRSYAYEQMGFDHIYDIESFTGKASGWNSQDIDFLDQSFQKIILQQQPFFSYLITMQSHGPFKNHNSLSKTFLKKQIPSIYSDIQWDLISSIYEVDKAIEFFVEKFKSSSLYDNSTLIIFGDHESGLFKKISDKDHVPMFIIQKGAKHERIKIPASHLDIAPIVLHFLGIKIDTNYKWLGSYPLNENRKIVFNDGNAIKILNGKTIVFLDTTNYLYANFSKYQLH